MQSPVGVKEEGVGINLGLQYDLNFESIPHLLKTITDKFGRAGIFTGIKTSIWALSKTPHSL